MIRVLAAGPAPVVDLRIRMHPNLTPLQLEAIQKAGRVDPEAQAEGMDARQYPVIRANFPTGEARYALFRNGKPTGVKEPLSEEWK